MNEREVAVSVRTPVESKYSLCVGGGQGWIKQNKQNKQNKHVLRASREGGSSAYGLLLFLLLDIYLRDHILSSSGTPLAGTVTLSAAGL